MKQLLSLLISFLGFVVIAIPVSAHVTVKPGEVGIGERTNFVVSVPTEESVPTTQLRLLIPEGIRSVRPNVKSGWTIEIKRSGEGEDTRVTELIWSGGRIPADQRDEFVFSAQAPTAETTLSWKAYQTYANGHVVAWDASPEVVEKYAKENPTEGEDDHSAPKPYSETQVINDLSETEETVTSESSNDASSNTLSLIALALSAASLGMHFYNRDKKRV